MSYYRRSHIAGATYFFTLTTYQRLALLTEERVRTAVREAIGEVRISLPFEIDAWVLLPDHLHAIWTLPMLDRDYGKRWGLIKSIVSRQCGDLIPEPSSRSFSRIRRREIDFWQRRFLEN